MSLAGFFLELLIPGATGSAVLLLILLELDVFTIRGIQKEQSWFLIALFLMVSYILGIILRHVPGFEKPKHFYCKRINKQWPKVAKALATYLTARLRETDTGDESALICPTDGVFRPKDTTAFITYLRDYVLSQKSGISDLFNYEWRFSRLARNCAPPLICLFYSCCVLSAYEAQKAGCRIAVRWAMATSILTGAWLILWGFSRSTKLSPNLARRLRIAVVCLLSVLLFLCLIVTCVAFFGHCRVAGFYAGGGLASALVLFGLWWAYKQRVYWQVDILMRVGSFAFLQISYPFDSAQAKFGVSSEQVSYFRKRDEA